MRGMVRACAVLAVTALVTPAARAEWRQLTSDHMVIWSNDRDERALRRVADDVERFDAASRRVLGVAAPGSKANKLQVFVVPGVDGLRAIQGSPENWTLGMYRPGSSDTVALVPGTHGTSPASTLYGDTAGVLLRMYGNHLFARTMSGSVPRWLRNGMVEALSTAVVKPDGAVQLGGAESLQAYERERADLPLEALLTLPQPSKSEAEQARAVAKAWLFAHYFLFDEARGIQLKAFLQALDTGAPPLAAARQAFGDLAKLDAALHAYAVQKRLPVRLTPATELQVTRFQVRALTPGEGAMMVIHMRSAYGVTSRTAPLVATDARAVAASYPADATVQVWLAEAEHDVQQYAAAEAAEARALAADPRLARAHYYRALTAFSRARRGKDQSAATWESVRALARTAMQMDPDRPAPLVLYFTTYLFQNARPSAEALAALERAHALAPEAPDLPPLLIRGYLATGRFAEARPLLALYAADPGSSPAAAAAAAARMITAIDAGRAEEQIDVFNQAVPFGIAT